MQSEANKICPHCLQEFTCRRDDISYCDCFKVKMSEEARSALQARFEDCLCNICLQKLSSDSFKPGTAVDDGIA